MPAAARIRIGLAGKLAALLVASTAVFFMLYGYVNLRDLRRHSEARVVENAGRLTDLIRRSTHYEMLRNDREALHHIVQEIASGPGILRIRISNPEGHAPFSTGRKDSGAARSFIARRPIENMPACSNAACHSHRADQPVLGVIEAELSLAGVDAESAAQQRHLTAATLVAVLLVSLASGLYIWLVVHKPVRELTLGTRRVAGGDLEYRLPVRSGDELGELAAEFNRMTAELERAKAAELQRTEKMASIGKLAATVAHEVNNPLFGVLTYARLTLRKLAGCDLPDEDKREMVEQLQVIERESKRCGDIMRNLLTFARQAPSHREPNDVNELIGRAVLLVRHKLELQQIALGEDLAQDLPPVCCDAGQIQQVMLILLVNAAEAMASGGRVDVATRGGGAQVTISVRDNGPGIDPGVLPKIFEPFFTTKEDQLRTGLGLAVARSIVEQHGGEIAVTSKTGEGTEFVVTLPRGVVEPAGPSPAGGAREVVEWEHKQQ